jgi:DNA topoisomerase IB
VSGAASATQPAHSAAVPPSPITELKAAAKLAKLRYVSDRMPGITRVRTVSGFEYRNSEGTKPPQRRAAIG